MAVRAKGQTSKFLVWIILILLVVGLAGFGATGLGGQVRSVGKVGDTEIGVDRYARELNQELRAFSAQTGQNITLLQAQQFGVDRVVLQRLVSAAAMENEVNRIGLSVGDEEVRRQVLSSPAFQGLNGDFDRDAYEFSLDQAGLTASGFEDSVRSDSASTMLSGAVTGGLAAPATYADVILGYVGERRNFSWIELDRTSLSDPLPEADPADLRAYYDANTGSFMLPESKRLTYAWLSPDSIIDDIEVDEAALRELFEERASEYNVPERRLVERLIYGTNEEAETAMAQIEVGSITFDDAVTARGLELSDVDLGDVTQEELGAAGDAVFALTEPGIAGPVETNLGPALIRVNAILSARETPFEDARDDLKEELAADRARRVISDQITEFDDLLAGGATVEDLAEETGMELGQLDWTQGASEGIAAYADFESAARQVNIGDFPEIIELDDGGVFALRLDEVVAAHPEPFEDAQDKVAEAWELAELKSRLSEEASVLNAQLENGARIGTLGLPVTVETHITRDAFIEGTPPDFLTEVFGLAASESVVVDSAESVLIAQITDILPPEADDPDTLAIRDAVDTEVVQSIAQDILAAFTVAIEQQAGISLNQSALNAVHAQFP